MDGATTDYIWDVGAALPVILQGTAAGGTTYCVHGLDLISEVEGETTTYYLYDGLGSTTELADGSGDVTGSYRYDVFGAEWSQEGMTTEWSFTGEQNDPNGLVYLRARYYDPATGRFLSRDPWPFLEPYAYAANNPCLYVDPSGNTASESVGTYTVCRSWIQLWDLFGNLPPIPWLRVLPSWELFGYELVAEYMDVPGGERWIRARAGSFHESMGWRQQSSTVQYAHWGLVIATGEFKDTGVISPWRGWTAEVSLGIYFDKSGQGHALQPRHDVRDFPALDWRSGWACATGHFRR